MKSPLFTLANRFYQILGLLGYNTSPLAEPHAWFLDNLERMQEVFEPLVKDI